LEESNTFIMKMLDQVLATVNKHEDEKARPHSATVSRTTKENFNQRKIEIPTGQLTQILEERESDRWSEGEGEGESPS
jgi:hypothetical protein